MKLPVYMDYHATTPVDPRVLDAMLPYFTGTFGNPASRQHRFGWEAEAAVESGRSLIARALGAEPREIIFTSGSTESNNLAIKGVAQSLRQKGGHVVTVQTEHHSVLDACRRLEKLGMTVTYLPVDANGKIDLDRFRDAIGPETILVSVMCANNEIGTIQDLVSIGRIAREKDVVFHTDATQAVGALPINVDTMNIDLLSFTGHKIYGPKGSGALYVRSKDRRVHLVPQVDGGGHERGLRSGTLNVPGIVGLARALELSTGSLDEENRRISSLRDAMHRTLTSRLDGVALNGHPSDRLPNNLNVSFEGVEDSALMMSMKDIAVSTGSACSTANPEPSHVLKALHLPPERLHSSIRFGLGRFTTAEETEYVTGRVIDTVQKLRTAFPARSAKSSRAVPAS